jgi:O-antigen ligase
VAARSAAGPDPLTLQIEAPVREPAARAAPKQVPARAWRLDRFRGRGELGAIAVAGAVLGALPAANGLYGIAAWTVAGIVAALCLVVGVVGLNHRPPLAALVAPVLLGLLGILQLASQAWAESTAQASVDGHRTLVYAAALGVLVLLSTDSQRRAWLLGGVAAGATIVGVVTAVRLAGPHGPDLFFRSRLFEPLGYSNGTAAMLLIPCWPLIAVAERARQAVAAGAALSAAAFLVSISILAQSRAALGALVVSAVIVLVFVPRRLPRLGVVALIAGAAALAWPALAAVASGADAAMGIPAVGTLRHAVLQSALTSAGAGVVWGLAVGLFRRAPRPSPGALRAVSVAVLAGVVAAITVGAVAVDAPRVATNRWHDFRAQRGIDGGSRFSTGGGNRYDYWRIALNEWRDRPIAGVGAGNYDVRYLRDRRSDEVVRQPHSLEFQTLAETGLLGFALLVALAAVVAAGVMRGARRARGDPAARGVVVAALGVVTLFVLQTSVDWLHLLPGLALVALAAMAAFVGMLGDDRPSVPLGRPVVRPVLVAASIVLVASLGVVWLADHKRQDASAQLASDPTAALASAKQAVRLDRGDVDNWTALAAAEARLDRYGAARGALRKAVSLEPHDPVPLALLGDLATRAGDRRLAAASYARASRLNPRDTTLAELAKGVRP